MTHMNQIDASLSRDDAEFSDDEIATMGRVIKMRFGDRAGLTAQLLASEHDNIGDVDRASAWRRVAIELGSAKPH